jgi:hypothetical protein
MKPNTIERVKTLIEELYYNFLEPEFPEDDNKLTVAVELGYRWDDFEQYLREKEVLR